MTPAEAARHAFEAERRYLDQHRAAQANRLRAAAQVDAAAGRWGEILSWRTARDDRVTWDCAVLSGLNFRVSDPPNGHYPGATHFRCRCTVGPPIPGARIVGKAGV
jgi:SPP1 gp7 family putative phage head morphogenesis protein